MELGTAIVTGANRADGIGIALVRRLREAGFSRVVGTYRRIEGSEALLDLAAADAGVLAAELDVASAGSVAAFGAWCTEHLGHVDLLVNNAGTGVPREPITRAPIERLEEALQAHGVGMVRVTRALLPLMGRGSVIANISSGSGSIAGMGAHSAYYGPAKALQNALTRQLGATLLSDGIVAYAVSPGWVATSMSSGPGAPLTPEGSADQLVDLFLRSEERHAGTFRDVDGSTLPW